MFRAEGVTLKSITEPHLDMSTPEGRLMFNVKGAIDQFERENTIRRTKDGLAVRKRQGMYLGAKPKVDKQDIAEMKRLRKAKKMPVAKIAKKFGISTSAVYLHTSKRKPAQQAQQF
jgi:DNA invertase Pin-like site-specific DNA recombinase